MSVQSVEFSGLESATWPVMLLDDSAVVRRSNAAARTTFGDKLPEGGAPLSGLWSGDNELTPVAFIAQVRQAKGLTTTLRLRGKGLAITSFSASACMVGSDVILQLLPANGVARPDR